ncbi:geranylgeranyl pyrophosphate synthetase [Penicillium samsonianum]|uniref:geranylgeranyl pyrophosphate synthetase n=1 Tax=Penicillium samsonianum TaxID=1882272 RepID=UPI00254998EF|nr:geranylgeranyl pyrophosphate synthetase [Penicillium samsonianum]KAJ6137342.1 geranylgeranyl pyrophosphate synthetase [Penicillium samsonianum]
MHFMNFLLKCNPLELRKGLCAQKCKPQTPTQIDVQSGFKEYSPTFQTPTAKLGGVCNYETDTQDQCKLEEEKVFDNPQAKIISAPYTYLCKNPGKDIRGKLISAFNEAMKIPEVQLQTIKDVVGLLHVASLLIDDIEDSSTLRRGLPVAHRIFGIPQTINSANFIYFQAQSRLTNLHQPEAFEIFTEELLKLHRGQGMDIHWRDSLTCPTEEEYIEMISNKTGGLFRLAIRLMQLESESSQDYVPLAETLGILFQVRDDYQNLQSKLYSDGKGFAEDITEGKFSYPIIHSIRNNPGDFQLLDILRQRTDDEAVKLYAIQIIESTASFEYCRQKMTTLTAQVRGMLDSMGEGNDLAGLKSLLRYIGSI